jgi:hypothetical protein
MEWENRNIISSICIVCFLIFLIIASWLNINKLEYQSNIAFIISEAIVSIPITLILIEWVIKRDREKQWEKVKSATYMSILEHVTIIARSASIHCHIKMKGEALENAQILERGLIEPNRKVPIAIIELSINSKQGLKIWLNQIRHESNKELRKELMDKEATSLSFFYEDIKWRLDEIITTLIPRVLQLSDDKEVNLALLRFEKFCRRFNEFMNGQKVLKEFPMASQAMPKFLSELGIAYDVVLREIPSNERESIVLFIWPWDDY